MKEPTHPVRLFLGRWLGLAIVGTAVVALGLGFWGWVIVNQPKTLGDYSNTAFQTLQLLTFQFPHDGKSTTALPLPLNIARFLLPSLALLQSYRLVARAIGTPLRLAVLALRRGHIVIVPGKGAAGRALMYEASRQKARAVAIAPDLLPFERAHMEEFGLPIVASDPFLPEAWHEVRVDHADLVMVSHGSDVDNLNILVTVANSFKSKQHGRRAMLVATLENEGLAEQVDLAMENAARRSSLRYRRLSIADEGARTLFLDPPMPSRKQCRSTASHIILIGLGPGALAVLRQALTLGQDVAESGPHITVIAPGNDLAAVQLLQPGVIFDDLARLSLVPCDVISGVPASVLDTLFVDAPQTTMACVCLPDEAAARVGMAFAREVTIRGWPDFTVAIHQQREDRFLSLLATEKTAPEHVRLRPFGGILPKGTVRRLQNEREDQIPRAIHSYYLAMMKREKQPGGTIVEWGDLPENMRHANRAAADHIAIKLASVGCEIVSRRSSTFAFSEAELSDLARIEHRRWCAERILRDWRPAPRGVPRDNIRRLHPDLVAFEELSEPEQQKDRDAVLHIQEILTIAGLSIRRLASTQLDGLVLEELRPAINVREHLS